MAAGGGRGFVEFHDAALYLIVAVRVEPAGGSPRPPPPCRPSSGTGKARKGLPAWPACSASVNIDNDSDHGVIGIGTKTQRRDHDGAHPTRQLQVSPKQAGLYRRGPGFVCQGAFSRGDDLWEGLPMACHCRPLGRDARLFD